MMTQPTVTIKVFQVERRGSPPVENDAWVEFNYGRDSTGLAWMPKLRVNIDIRPTTALPRIRKKTRALAKEQQTHIRRNSA